MAIDIRHGDCLEVMRTLPDCSVDSIVTDPPYGLAFMGKRWDYDVPSVEVWQECLRVLKPGGHLLAFAGTRTQHRMAVRIEDAGFEIRDMIAWVYGSGFPKSADVSKHIDAAEKKRWLDVAKAVDNADKYAILTAWKEYSKTASDAGLLFRKSETATGTNTPRSDSVPASVLLQANPESSDAAALVAELSLSEARLISEASCSFVQSLAENSTTELRSPATSAGSQPANHEATLSMLDSSALQSALGWQGESTADKLKAVEALKTWLGRTKSSSKADTAALCAALTADLKRIILSRSETYRNADMTQQTAFASVITATITESTAASLILFTVDTLRNKAIDKAAGAEREVSGITKGAGIGGGNTFTDDNWKGVGRESYERFDIPATPEAQQWQGWGTALKPALEPITMARKPLIGNVAENVLTHGTGAINVDGCRVPTEDVIPKMTGKSILGGSSEGWDRPWKNDPDGLARRQAAADAAIEKANLLGRWPANLIHDGSEEVMELFPNDGDSTAARFFYCPKADQTERGDGNNHPTVKPVDLMRYLVRLVTREGGTALEPFGGSGTTAVACVHESCNCIIIERESQYVEIIKQRIAKATQQQRLF